MQIKVLVCWIQPLRKGRFIRDTINVCMFPIRGEIAFSITQHSQKFSGLRFYPFPKISSMASLHPECRESLECCGFTDLLGAVVSAWAYMKSLART